MKIDPFFVVQNKVCGRSLKVKTRGCDPRDVSSILTAHPSNIDVNMCR